MLADTLLEGLTVAGASRSRPFLTPNASPLRRAVELRSATALLYIRSLPKSLPPLVVVGLLAGGVLADPPVSTLCLIVVTVLFSWLLFLSWPALIPKARMIRLGVLFMMAVGVLLTATR